MEKREFQAESKRLLDLVINSIYTNKDIFLRELISNSSDAIDKIYYRALTDDNLSFNKEDYYIEIEYDEDERILKIIDTGIGMTKEELDRNLGTIAKSGSYDFKRSEEMEEGHDIIGQFGVGFYSAFMVADKIEVLTKSLDSQKAYKWTSTGEDGYTIEEASKDNVGTEITLYIKEDSEDESYSDYLKEYKLRQIIKKHSDYIRYPIKMLVKKRRLKEGSEDEYEDYEELEVINSMLPLWKRNRTELKDEDYENFYREKAFGFDKPIHHIHMNVDGMIRFNSILYIPSTAPYDFYTKDYEKGLELYSNGVLIMDKCEDLLPDYFSFVKGIVDSEDLSLNISREMLQKDRQLSLIARNIEKKIRGELEDMMKKDREKYEEFFQAFGPNIKFGVYDQFGKDADKLKDLVLLQSSRGRLVSFKEYIDEMKEDQKYIYYSSGETLDKVESIPQTQFVKEEGYEVLYLLNPVDEFVIKFMHSYEDKEFKSVTDDDLGIDTSSSDEKVEETLKEDEDLFKAIKEELGDKIVKVRPSMRLKDDPVRFTSQGEVSIEMEKAFAYMPEDQRVVADKVLEINLEHPIYNKLKDARENNEEEFKILVDTIYNQARLIEGLIIEDPVKFANNIWQLI